MIKPQSVKILDRLSTTCQLTGLFSIVLGFVVIFMDILNHDLRHVAVGIYIISIGYSFVKIGAKVSMVLFLEKSPSTQR